MTKQEIFIDQYTILRLIGQGYHSQVFLLQNQNKQKFAAKVFNRNSFGFQQVQYLGKLSHPHIIQILQFKESYLFQNKHQEIKQHSALILEFAENGDMFELLKRSGRFSENLARTLFHQILSAIQYIHQLNICHLDIKPQNILLDKNFNIKLTDFGFSSDCTRVLTTQLGTEGYKSPEIYQKKYDGKKADIFALGVVLFIMVSGKLPFMNATKNDSYFKLFRNHPERFWEMHSQKKRPNFFSAQFKKLIEGMMNAQEQKRWRIDDIKNCEWFNGQISSEVQVAREFLLRQSKLKKTT